jgi:tripartite ATP-independent transporter DctM subunit
MTTVAERRPTGYARAEPLVARALGRVADWLELYSRAVTRIAYVGAVLGALTAAGAIAVNVFTRYVLGYSLQGSDELANFAFLWTIWMGVSLAVKRGAVTTITLISERGPAWWRYSVKAFSGISLAVLLGYCCLRATQYATHQGESLGTASPGLGVAFFYPIASMAVGYYFITLHYAAGVARGAARLAARGRGGAREAAIGGAGALAIGALVWAACYGLLAAGASKLIVLGLIFVVLTLAGTPIVFMLSIVGILSTMDFLGLSFYPNVGADPLFPFRTTQNTMGLTGAPELIVILMFLIVAEVMNASGMSDRLIRFAAACVGHLRGGMAYVCQVTSALVSGISGSAQADAAVMTPLLVPAMEKEGYPRDVAAAVVAGASIKGPIGPISIMFIVYGYIVSGVSISALLLSGVMAEILLLLFQAGTVYLVVRHMGVLQKRPFAGLRTVGQSAVTALPVLAIPVVIVGGILGGVFTPTESAAVAVVVVFFLSLFWYSSVGPVQLPRIIATAALETGIVLLLLGDSAILSKVLFIDQFGQSLSDFLTGLTSDKYVFLLVVNLLLLAVGIFIEPLPALYVLAPFLAPIATVSYGIDPVHFGLIMVFNLVLALIHPPIGLVLFVVSSLSRVSVERLSIMILPWLAVSLVVLFLVTYLPSEVVLALANRIG